MTITENTSGNKFVNVDTSSPDGLRRAREMGLDPFELVMLFLSPRTDLARTLEEARGLARPDALAIQPGLHHTDLVDVFRRYGHQIFLEHDEIGAFAGFQ